MRRSPAWPAALLVLPLVGCGATAVVTDITSKPAGESFNGVPFRMLVPKEIEVWRFDDSKAVYERLRISDGAQQLLPDQDRLYAIGYRGGILADVTMTVTLDSGGSGALVKYALTDTKKVKDTIVGADEVVKRDAERRRQRVADFKEDAKERAESARTAADQADTELVGAVQAREDAQVAIDAADQALAKASANPSDPALAQAYREAASRVAVLKVKANVAFRRIGRPEPYPGVF